MAKLNGDQISEIMRSALDAEKVMDTPIKLEYLRDNPPTVETPILDIRFIVLKNVIAVERIYFDKELSGYLTTDYAPKNENNILALDLTKMEHQIVPRYRLFDGGRYLVFNSISIDRVCGKRRVLRRREAFEIS